MSKKDVQDHVDVLNGMEIQSEFSEGRLSAFKLVLETNEDEYEPTNDDFKATTFNIIDKHLYNVRRLYASSGDIMYLSHEIALIKLLKDLEREV